MNQEQYQIAYQIEQIQKVVENIDAQLNEVNSVKESLSQFKEIKADEQVLFPIANGIFASGKLDADRKLRMNVGNNVVVEKTVDEAISLMDTQFNEIDAYRKELLTQLDTLLRKVNG